MTYKKTWNPIFPLDGKKARFNKKLLKNILDKIKKNIENVEITWYRCKEPVLSYSKPSDYYQSKYDFANMVIVKKNGQKILESNRNKFGAGNVSLYGQNLNKNEFDFIAKIFKQNKFRGIVTSEEWKEGKNTSYIVIGLLTAILLYLIIAILNYDYLISLPFWTLLLAIFPLIILGILHSYYYFVKFKSKPVSNLEKDTLIKFNKKK